MNIFGWHRWFAWRPVRTSGPTPDTLAIIFLETIERRRVIEGRQERWEYRAVWS